MTTSLKRHVFACNGAKAGPDALVLGYDPNAPESRVNLQLPRFVDQVYHLPNRLLDLLEIAAYVFAADRATSRGPRDAVEYHAWPRSMEFHIKVRDAAFWNQEKVKSALCSALVFMTGDLEYSFEFEGGHSTDPASLFDREEFTIAPDGPASVVLFSGGLDSLAGTLERLARTDEQLYLISHRSGQPSTAKTQRALAAALKRMYPGRVNHYSFGCGLRKVRGTEETQRTRAFLFCCTAFALAHRVGLDTFYAYENGVTSLNFIRRQDLINARASRTTHPKTHALMADFLTEVQGGPVSVANPLWNQTKSDVLSLIRDVNGRDLVGSAVSCSKTFHPLVDSTHCGCCFQCIDRRLAAFAVGMQDVDDAGIYSDDVFVKTIESIETRTTVIDYVRQAIEFSKTSADAFVMDRLSELADVTPYVGMSEDMAVQAVWELCNRHGQQVVQALIDIRKQFDDPRYPIAKGSLLDIVASRTYLHGPAIKVPMPAPAVGVVPPVGTDTKPAEPERVVTDVSAGHVPIEERLFTRNGSTFLLPETVKCGDRLLSVEDLRAVAKDGDAQVLITGEKGTGKESVAEFIFAESGAPAKKCQALNCAGLEQDRADSDLFGHVRGAFTGAEKNRSGIFKLCEGGIVFLDEIGELKKEIQHKLLRFVEYGLMMPMGGDLETRVRTRVIGGTNADIKEALADDFSDRFRIRLELPTLETRLRDLLWFIGQPAFLGGGRYTGITLRALCCLFSQPWKDNIRGLRNCCQNWRTLGTGHAGTSGHIADIIEFGGVEAESWGRFAAYALAAVERQYGKAGVSGQANEAVCRLLVDVMDGGTSGCDGTPAALALDRLQDTLTPDAVRYGLGWLRVALSGRHKTFVAKAGVHANEVCDLGDTLAELATLREIYLALSERDRTEVVADTRSDGNSKTELIGPSLEFHQRLREAVAGPLWAAPEAPEASDNGSLEALMAKHGIADEDRVICRLCASGMSNPKIAASGMVSAKRSTVQERLRFIRDEYSDIRPLIPPVKGGRRSKKQPK